MQVLGSSGRGRGVVGGEGLVYWVAERGMKNPQLISQRFHFPSILLEALWQLGFHDLAENCGLTSILSDREKVTTWL